MDRNLRRLMRVHYVRALSPHPSNMCLHRAQRRSIRNYMAAEDLEKTQDDARRCWKPTPNTMNGVLSPFGGRFVR
jgi:hypothetical protein